MAAERLGVLASHLGAEGKPVTKMSAVDSDTDIQICVCGGGNAAHVMCADVGFKGYKVNMFMPYANEAAQFVRGTVHHDGVQINYVQSHTKAIAMPHKVSKNAHDVVPGSKYIFLPIPVFAHESTLMDIVPHCDDDAMIIALPATGAFDWTAERVFRRLGKRVAIGGIAPLPYVCRYVTYGSEVNLFGKKREVGFATMPPKRVARDAPVLEKMLGFSLKRYPSFVPATLTPTNPIMHTARMYGMLVAGKEGYWRERKGFPCNPKFYDDCDAASNEWLERLDAENQKIVAAMEKLVPGCIEGTVLPCHLSLKWQYGDLITKWDTPGDCFRSNQAFHGLGSPMMEVAPGYWVPDFKNRYFTEDLPFGLLANRGLAELLGVPTPDMDTVITWAQMEMGKRWLVDGKVNVAETPQVSPQAFGFTLEDIKALYTSE